MTKKTSIEQHYYNIENSCKQKYGNKTIVLMQCGDFYETYQSEINNGPCNIIAEIFNFKIAKKQNYYMAGTPLAKFDEIQNILLNNNYVVVKVEQTSKNKDGTFQREITQVNILQSYKNKSTINLSTLCIFYEKYISCLDRHTNNIHFYDIDNTKQIYEIISSINPQEILIYSNFTKDIFEQKYNLTSLFKNSFVKYYDEYPKDYDNNNYQKQFFNKLGKLTEHIDSNINLIPIMLLIQFSYEHSRNTKIHNISKIYNNDKCTLFYNTAEQLNLQDLYNKINKTLSIPGKKLLHHLIYNPITNIDKLNQSYSVVEQLREKYDNIRSNLKQIKNIESYICQLQSNNYNPTNISLLCQSIIHSCRVIHQFKKISNFDFNIDEKPLIKIAQLIKKINYENIANCKFNNNGEISSMEEPLICTDEIRIQFNSNFERINELLTIYNNKLPKNKRSSAEFEIKKYCDDTIYAIWGKANICKKIDNKSKIYTNISKKYILRTEELNKIYNEDNNNHNKLVELSNEILRELLPLIITNSLYLKNVATIIAQIDVWQSFAYCADKYNYNKPNLIQSDSDISNVKTQNMRHPIVELISDQIYTPNHFQDNKLLLFGVNSSGKTTYAKSIGLCVIMAQIGSYVPCSNMELIPFKKIMTRLSGNDDIMSGKSTYMIELDELKPIIELSDSNTLVLGDELCKGTELDSGIAITTELLHRLNTKNTTFVLATHMHDIFKYDPLDFLTVKHIAVKYDEINNSLIYNRKLANGPGETHYGLEVAKYMGLDQEFVENAIQRRHKIINKNTQFLNTKKSKYNAKLYVDKCNICKTNDAVDVDHISEQYKANKFGIITLKDGTTFHKNKLANLQGLCKSCHLQKTNK